MNIFEKKLQVQTSPWPHVEINNFLQEDFANDVVTNFDDQNFRDKWWTYLKSKEKEYLKLIGETFNHDMTDLSFEEFNWVPWPGTETRERLKPIHCDGAAKKFQIMMYFGTKTPNGGELTFNEGNSEVIAKNFPFTHNKLILWPSTRDTWHTFYSLVGDTRYTLNIPIANEYEALEQKKQMLIIHEEKLRADGAYEFEVQRVKEKERALGITK